MSLWVYVEKEVPQRSSQDHPVFKCYTSLHTEKSFQHAEKSVLAIQKVACDVESSEENIQ